MADQKEVIKGLECVICPNIVCGDCSYFIRNESDPDTGWCDRDAIYKDALSLLKEQESQVMTLDEVIESGDLIYYERKGEYPEPVYVYKVGEDSFDIITMGNDGYQEEKRFDYGTGWRCWTSWPSDEQRKAVKWE